jgi:GNAT superfamily N-acetyltransferase
MATRWTSRTAGPEDGEGILELFREVCQTERSLDHWKWKFVENPTNKMSAFVAEDGGHIVGQYAVLPTFMSLRTAKVMGAQSLDTMTHPSYRRQGMFVSLAKQCLARAGSEGVELFYGFPNEQSYPGFVRELGWIDMGELTCLMKIKNHKPVAAIIQRVVKIPALAAILARPAYLTLQLWGRERRAGLADSIKIRSIDAFDDRFDALWAKVKETFPISVWKDSRYLNWRYVSCPDTRYTVLAAEEDHDLVGFIVVKLLEEPSPAFGNAHLSMGYIIDLICLPGREVVASLLITAALDHFGTCSADIVFCHMFEHVPYYGLLRARGFLKYPKGARLIVRLNEGGRTCDSIVFDRRQWHLMEGDIDMF